jgi:hypothetical protein
LEKAHTDAVAHLQRVDSIVAKVSAQYEKDISVAGKLADQQIAKHQAGAESVAVKAEKSGVRNVEEARAEAAKVASQFEKTATKERAALAKEQASAEKAVPKPSGKTDIDPMIAAAQGMANGPAQVSHGAVFGAGLSLAHGHPLTAATALLGSFAASRVRAQGNFMAARALRGISDRLATVDEQIRRGVASLFGRTGTRIVALGTQGGRQEAPPKLPKFEDVSRRVIEASANPSIISDHVQASLGQDAVHAPSTFVATLASAQRMQSYLEANLPREQVDARSLTPQLDEPGISDTEKDEFMRKVAVLNDPVRELFAETKEGTITPEQIEAVQFVYGGGLYRQIQAETLREVAQQKRPLEYERELAIGILLGQDTNEVLDRDFQGALRAAFQDKAGQGQPVGSKPRSAASKLTKDTMSTSQKLERGES